MIATVALWIFSSVLFNYQRFVRGEPDAAGNAVKVASRVDSEEAVVASNISPESTNYCSSYYAASSSSYSTCAMYVCGPTYLTVSLCSTYGGSYSGDPRLFLYSDASLTTLLTSNDDYCSYGSQFTYYVSSSTCAYYYLKETCFSSSSSCSGTVAYFTGVGPSESPTMAPTSTQIGFSTVLSSSLNFYCSAVSYYGTYQLAGSSSGVYISRNFGSSWAIVTGLPTASSYSAVGMSVYGQYMVAAAANYGLYYSLDYGTNWYLAYYTGGSYSNSFTNDIKMSYSGAFVIATLSPGGLLRSSNYGQSYTFVSNSYAPTSYYWYRVAMSYYGDVMYVTSNNGIYRSYSYGVTWSLASSLQGFSIDCDVNCQYVSMSPTSGNYVYVSTNYGSSFSPYYVASSQVYRMTAAAAAGQYMVVSTYDGSLYVSTNFGASWTLSYTGNGAVTYGLGMSYDGQYILAAVYSYGLVKGTVQGLSLSPSMAPTSPRPSVVPTRAPTFAPSPKPTAPTGQPSSEPSRQPSRQPSSKPSSQPVLRPTSRPTAQPSSNPSNPTSQPSSSPSMQPSRQPSSKPSLQPQARPSSRPSMQPSSNPTNPTSQPSGSPTTQPTSAPSEVPNCPAGTYYIFTDDGVRFECIACPAGSITATSKQRTCTACAAGTYAEEDGSSVCKACPLNTYQGSSGQSFCTKCKPNYVTGLTGSISSAACVNPSTNFYVGGGCLIVSMLCIFLYLCQGRLHRIAHHRKYRLVRKSIIMCGAASRGADLVNAASTIISTIIKSRHEKNFWFYLKKRVLKPLLFVLMAFVIVPLIVTISVFYSLSQVLFNALVIWRGYRFTFPISLNFVNQVDYLLTAVEATTNLPIFQILAYPFVYIATNLADFNINLSSVDVTCPGSQAPVYLLIDFLIVGVIIVIIESDLQIFWMTALKRVLGKARNLIFSRFFVSKSLCSTVYYAFVASLFALLPDPRKLIQYTMGFVALSTFFRQQGRSQSSNNCDNAVAIPADSILAYATTVFGLVMFFPVVYMFAEVLVPCFRGARLQEFVHLLDSAKKDVDDTGDIPVIDGVEIGAMDREGMRTAEVVKPARPMLKRLASEAAEGIDDALEKHHEANKSPLRHYLSCTLRFLSSLFSVDWMYIKFFVSFIRNMYEKHRVFLMTYHWEARAEPGEKEDTNLQRIRRESRRSQVPYLPWFLALREFSKDEDNIKEREDEKRAWRRVKREFPNYLHMVTLVRLDLYDHFPRCCRRNFAWLPWLYSWILCWAFPCQVIMSKHGRAIWLRVFKNYLVILLISFGIWPDFAVEEFDLMSKYNKFLGLLNYVEDRAAKLEETMSRTSFGVDDYEPDEEKPPSLAPTTSARNGTRSNVNVPSMTRAEAAAQALRDDEAVDALEENKSINDNDETNIDEQEREDEEFNEELRQSGAALREISTAQIEQRRAKFKKDEDAFARVQNDPRQLYMQYVSAIVSARVVLIQLAPVLTLWSVFAVELSRCPILVFSESMSKELPPLWLHNPMTRARDLLSLDYKGKKVPVLKVTALAGYLMVQESRIVQFTIIAFINVVSVGLVFFPGSLRYLVSALVVLLVVVGLLTAMFVLLLLHQFLFPVEDEDYDHHAAAMVDVPSAVPASPSSPGGKSRPMSVVASSSPPPAAPGVSCGSVSPKIITVIGRDAGYREIPTNNEQKHDTGNIIKELEIREMQALKGEGESKNEVVMVVGEASSIVLGASNSEGKE